MINLINITLLLNYYIVKLTNSITLDSHKAYNADQVVHSNRFIKLCFILSYGLHF